MLRRLTGSAVRPTWAPRPSARALALNRLVRDNTTAPPPSPSLASSSPDTPETAIPIQPIPPPSAPRKSGAFYISNVFPIRLSRWDPRPTWAVAREEALMEQLNDIGMEVQGHGFRIESWEIARKDGGVFLHYSYIPPDPASLPKIKQGEDVSYISALPDTGADSAASHPPSSAGGEGSGKAKSEEEQKAETAAQALAASPGRLFLPQLLASARSRGGFPSWLGQWWANFGSQTQSIPGHRVWARGGARYSQLKSVGEEEEENVVKGSGSGMSSVQAAAGGGRVWVVKGRQWIEDMSRPTANKLRVEFDGPDVSQEMLYTLFRPYGRVSDITPPAPVPAGSLRFAVVAFSRLTPATVALNCLHGFSTPTNTADYTLRRSGQSSTIPMSRLRLYYQHPLKAHAVRDWISGHPRLVLPVLAFILGTLSYTFFDPIRAFFVRSKLEGTFDLEQYGPIKWIKQQLGIVGDSLDFFRGKTEPVQSVTSVGQNAWEDRIAAEKEVDRWLSEYPSTFITVTGPPGSGKVSLVNRVLKKTQKPSLIVDCAEIAKAKNDAGLLSALAEETGYWPVFSFLSSLNGLIDLAAVGLIGQKAGFSTPIDQQLRQVLETVAGALKDVSAHIEQNHQDEVDLQKRSAAVKQEQEKRRQLIVRGGWHDGRLDCIAGNGVMSELGVGDEPVLEDDLDAPPSALMDDVAPIRGEAVPPTAASLREALPSLPAPVAKEVVLDADSEHIKSLPIVVLKNFATKSAKGDAWNVIAEWGASLIENRIAHVIVITEGPTATKALVRAQPAKPLNSVALADADEANSLVYVQDKLGPSKGDAGTLGQGGSLSIEDRGYIAKLGGRMVDLETLVYKVRTGSTVKDAVQDIVLRNTIELRKAAFGDDAEDAKNLPWTRAQAWKVVSELAKNGQLPYAKVLQEFPFKGAEQSLKSMEEHELISISYHEGRASRIRPGKPVFRYAFASLVDDPVFRASSKIEYNATLIAKAESEIKAAEAELATLQGITANGGDQALGVPDGGWLGLGKSSAIKERARYLLDKMKGNVEKLEGLEKESAEMLKSLSAK